MVTCMCVNKLFNKNIQYTDQCYDGLGLGGGLLKASYYSKEALRIFETYNGIYVTVES